MDKDIPKKEEVWIRVVIAYVQAGNSTNKEGAIRWADFIVKEYEERFSQK